MQRFPLYEVSYSRLGITFTIFIMNEMCLTDVLWILRNVYVNIAHYVTFEIKVYPSHKNY